MVNGYSFTCSSGFLATSCSTSSNLSSRPSCKQRERDMKHGSLSLNSLEKYLGTEGQGIIISNMFLHKQTLPTSQRPRRRSLRRDSGDECRNRVGVVSQSLAIGWEAAARPASRKLSLPLRPRCHKISLRRVRPPSSARSQRSEIGFIDREEH